MNHLIKEVAKRFRENLDFILLAPIFLVCLILVLVSCFTDFEPFEYYLELARSILSGRLDVTYSPSSQPMDLAHFSGRSFLVWGLLPSVILLPFAAIFGDAFHQRYLNLFLVGCLSYLVYKLNRRFGYRKKDSFWLTSAYLFATAFIGILTVSVSTFLPHLIGTILIFCALNEFFGRRSWFKIGIFLGLAFLTRPNFIFNAFFFSVYPFLTLKKSSLQKDLLRGGRKLLALSPGLICAATTFMIYNFIRFQSPFEVGYRYLTDQAVPPENFFSFSYFWKNFRHFLFRPPEIFWSNLLSLRLPFLKVPLSGIGILFTSPIFLLLFRKKSVNLRVFLLLLVPAFFGLTFSFLWFSHGGAQFGYRFFLDFQPLIYVALLHKLSPPISPKQKALIFLSILANLIFFFSFINC